MTQARAVLAGTGIAVPPLEIDNHRLARIIETSDEWIRERSGVETRYYVERGVGSSDLGAEAARAALADAGMEPGEVDYLVCATMTPDHYFPGSGTLIQQKLGLRPLPALDIRQQCAGFAYGLQMVDALIRSGVGAQRPPGGDRRPHRPDALLGPHLRGAPRPRSRTAFGRGLPVELPVPPPPRAFRGRRRRHGLPGGGGERPWDSGLRSLRRRQPQGHPLRARRRIGAPAVGDQRDDQEGRAPCRSWTAGRSSSSP